MFFFFLKDSINNAYFNIIISQKYIPKKDNSNKNKIGKIHHRQNSLNFVKTGKIYTPSVSTSE